MSNAKKKQYTDAEKRAYWMGQGSALSHNAPGRKKQICTQMGGDLDLINSYRRGRAKGMADKKAYLAKQKATRAAASRSGKTARSR